MYRLWLLLVFCGPQYFENTKTSYGSYKSSKRITEERSYWSLKMIMVWLLMEDVNQDILVIMSDTSSKKEIFLLCLSNFGHLRNLKVSPDFF